MVPTASAARPLHVASPATSTKPSTTQRATSPTASSEEDDYLTMSIPDPSTSSSSYKNKNRTKPPAKESLTSSYKRRALLSEQRGRPKSKAELAAEEAKKREEALSTNTLSASNKGFQMMAKLGYKPGEALGKKADAVMPESSATAGRGGGAEEARRLLEPVGLEMKEGRSGIGADSERKRKFREEVERKLQGEKRLKVEEGEFQGRGRLERERRRVEGQVVGAQKVCEELEEEEEDEARTNDGEERKGENGLPFTTTTTTTTRRKTHAKPPLRQINVLWRGLIKRREVAERDRRMRSDLQHSSLPRILPTYTDLVEDQDDHHQMPMMPHPSPPFSSTGQQLQHDEAVVVVDLDLDQEDEELDAFEALEPAEQLARLVAYLRERWRYCFWCKFRYLDQEALEEGCPGLTEEDHD